MEFNIDGFLDQFAPFLLSLRNVDGYKIIDVEVPNNWDVGKLVKDLMPDSKNVQTVLTEQDDQNKLIAIVGSEKHHTFGVLFDRLDRIVRVNQEREEKNKLFKTTVKRLEKLFIDSNLEQLQKLVIDVDEKDQETQIGNTDDAQISSSPLINDESDDEVAQAVASKQGQIPAGN